MKLTWLTQAGLLFDTGSILIMVDPYLSNSVGEKDPRKNRRIAVDESFLEVVPNVLIITHDHMDHLDFKTLDVIFKTAEEKGKTMTVISPYSAYLKLLAYGGSHNYLMMNEGSVWSESGVTFYAVKAEHSDLYAAGYIIDDGSHTYYVSGDTLYNYNVIDGVCELCEDGVDYAFLPINGVGNNMNAHDAADMAYEIGAKCAIPIHYGLFDNIDPSDFDFENKIILEPYEEIEI